MSSPITIALANQKGGCGKTTTTVSIAAGLARAGKSVVVADADPQCNATDSFGLDRDTLAAEGRFTIADAYLAERTLAEIAVGLDERFDRRLRVVPGHRGLGTVPQHLEAELQTQIARGESSDLDAGDVRDGHRRRLRVAAESLAGETDFLIIDTPPDLGFLMTTALIAADWFVIPVFPSGYDLKGLETLMKTTEKVRAKFNPGLRLLGVALGNFDTSARLDTDILQMIRRKFGEDLVFNTVITRSVKHREAPLYGRSIFEHASGLQAARQFEDLSREIVARTSAGAAHA